MLTQPLTALTREEREQGQERDGGQHRRRAVVGAISQDERHR